MKYMKYMVALLACAGIANASIIQPTGVTQEYGSLSSADNAINGAGLSSTIGTGSDLADALLVTHAFGGEYGTSFISDDVAPAGGDFFADITPDTDFEIVCDLGSSMNVGTILLWNYGYDWGPGNQLREVEVRVSDSLDFTASALTTIIMKPARDGDADPSNDMGSVGGAQAFALGAQTGQYVQLLLTDNYYDLQGIGTDGGDRVGLGEVRFASEVIPEPATLGLLAVFGGAVLFIRRKMII